MNEAKPSKSARKRDLLALQSLGEKLIPLEPGELEKLPLDGALLEAIVRAKQITSRSASRRQRQLIGKLMRNADADSIQTSLEKLKRQERLARTKFREAEQWRDLIATEGAPAAARFSEHTGSAQPRVDELLRELEAAKNEPARRAIRRRMFREIFQVIDKVIDNLTETGDQ